MDFTNKIRRAGIYNYVMSLFPCKARSYMMKWLELNAELVDYVYYGDGRYSDVCINIILSKTYSGTCFYLIEGKNSRDVWCNALEVAAKLSNMRNVEELCIWLDLRSSK